MLVHEPLISQGSGRMSGCSQRSSFPRACDRRARSRRLGSRGAVAQSGGRSRLQVPLPVTEDELRFVLARPLAGQGGLAFLQKRSHGRLLLETDRHLVRLAWFLTDSIR
jgi:hypothetical protein